MIFETLMLLYGHQEPEDRKLLTGHNLRIMRSIHDANVEGLKPYIRRSIRIQHVDNVYQDFNDIFAKRFSNAQLERTWHVLITSGYVSKATSKSDGRKILQPFANDIGDELSESRDGWYPTTFNYKGQKGILSKIASGAYYFVEMNRTDGRKPVINRIWDLDHAKSWEDAWRNRSEEQR